MKTLHVKPFKAILAAPSRVVAEDLLLMRLRIILRLPALLLRRLVAREVLRLVRHVQPAVHGALQGAPHAVAHAGAPDAHVQDALERPLLLREEREKPLLALEPLDLYILWIIYVSILYIYIYLSICIYISHRMSLRIDPRSLHLSISSPGHVVLILHVVFLAVDLLLSLELLVQTELLEHSTRHQEPRGVGRRVVLVARGDAEGLKRSYIRSKIYVCIVFI